MPEEPGSADVIAEQRELLSRLRAVAEAKDAENAVLRAALDASLERERRLELRLAEVERRLSMDSSDSGAPSSRERIGRKSRGGRGSSPSGSAGRTASGEDSPATRGRAWDETRARAR